MSQKNVDLVRRSVKDVDFFWSLLDDNVVWDLGDFPRLDLDPVYVGREAVIDASRRYWGTWDGYAIDAEEIIEAGSSVAIAVYERGRGRGSGAPVERRYAQVWRFQQGRIVRWELFPGVAQALKAVGLPE